MSFLCPSSGDGKPESATILPFPARGPFAVHVERERNGEAWVVICRNHGRLHGNFSVALRDARDIAQGFGVGMRSSAGRVAP
jgi:hypothetical protein